MTQKEKVVFCWSGGKDSALALHRILRDDRYEVVTLLTTCNEHFQRVSMHGVRLELADMQARAIGLPLQKIFMSERSSNVEYEEKMSQCFLEFKKKGVSAVVYGDIFLEDLRAWREASLARIGMSAIFPLWKSDTRALMGEFLQLGFGSIICCVSDAYLDERSLGCSIDGDFLRELPADVDPCGENGEFHSFAFAGPIFSSPLDVRVGEIVYRPIAQTHAGSVSTDPQPCSLPQTRVAKGFWFCDLVPATG